MCNYTKIKSFRFLFIETGVIKTLIKIKTKTKTGMNILYFECVYCKVNYNAEKVIISIDIKRENGANKENITMKDKELYINSEKIK